MVAGELGTLRDQNLPVILVVLQDAACADRTEAAPGRAEHPGVRLGRTDLAALPPPSARLEQRRRCGMRAALLEALARPISVIACSISADSYVDAF